jgi:hypothetical protein
VIDTKFHVEHVVALQHGGSSMPDNLALACDRCNFLKGPNLSAIDPGSGAVVRLFNPWRDVWSEHFIQVNFEVAGRKDIGRATVRLLEMNHERRVHLRVFYQLDLNDV